MKMPGSGSFSRAIVITMIAVLLIGITGCGTAPAATAAVAPSVTENTQGRYIDEIFSDLEVTSNIEYASKANETGKQEALLLDIYQPKGDTLENRPAVIFVHGGGFATGDKAGGIEKALAVILAKKGYVTLSINYRLRKNPSTDWVSTFADATSDAYSALEWLVKNKEKYRVDAGHIAFGGHSAGSNIVVELCYSDWSQKALPKSSIFAVIAMAGPEMIRGRPGKDDPFGIIIHGEKDELVPYQLSETLANTFDQSGTPYVLYGMPGMSHNLLPAVNEVDDVVTQYLYKAMTGKDAGVKIQKYEEELKQIISKRLSQNPTFSMQRIDAVIDGKLDEWGQVAPMPLNQLKDAGTALPAADDCTAEGRIAWDAKNPSRILVAVTATDDIFQENGSPNIWENDSMELFLDFSQIDKTYPIQQWIFNVNGRDAASPGNNPANYEVKVVRDGHKVIFELAADISKTVPELAGFDLKGKTIGFSLCYNDCEENTRQHQLGIVAGETWSPANFANLKFPKE